MNAQKHVAFRIQQLCQDTVIHFRGGNLQEGSRAELSPHLELQSRGKAEGRGSDKVLDVQTGGGQPVPFKGEPFPVRVQDAVQQLQPLPAIQHLRQSTHDLEMVQCVQGDPGKPSPGRPDIRFRDGQNQQLGFHNAVVALFQLPPEHLGIKLPDAVEGIPLGGDLDPL